jgi:hypothetical protein
VKTGYSACSYKKGKFFGKQDRGRKRGKILEKFHLANKIRMKTATELILFTRDCICSKV